MIINIEIEKLSTATKGAIAELCVATDLMKKGYAVFRALSPNCFCDLVVYKDGISFYIEVRTGYESKLTKKLGGFGILRQGATCFGIYERNSGQIYYYNEKKEIVKL